MPVRMCILLTVLATARPMRVPVQTATRLVFGEPSPAPARQHFVCGTKSALLCDATLAMLPLGLPAKRWTYLVNLAASEATVDGSKTTWMFKGSDGQPSTIVAAVLPETCSRHASPVRPHALTALLRGTKSADVLVVLEDTAHAGGAACAIARAFPTYTAKTRPSTQRETEETVAVGFATREGPLTEDYSNFAAAAEAVRRAARFVDLPPDVLGTNAFVNAALAAADRLTAKGFKVESSVLQGDAVREAGYGLLWAVGKAAEEPPALVILSHMPEAGSPPTETVCLVGKGIVYDTGGLSLKGKTGMPGMKSDCGGAAALLGAFEAAVEIGLEGKALHLVLCLAENAIGPRALRNDDVVTGLSGLSCEINNSDAEGRLVLADGVALATAVPPRLPGLQGQPDLIIDMATLTGAQMVATGKRHAGIVANSDEVEAAAVAAGKISGDTCHPLPFVPEYYTTEFASKVADMKNSVKDRNNAQSSCAATFIYNHIEPSFDGGWLHVDLAGPSFIDDRGTGYGVGLALALLQVDGFKSST